MPKFNMPYKIKETISYDPTARDLSVEVAKAKATGADALLVVSRLNDAILLTRELVKQRWSPMGDPQHGAGLVRGSVSQDARQARRRPAQLRALVRPEQEAEQAARSGARPRNIRASTSTPTTSTRSRRCWSPPTPTSAPSSADPKALADAIRATNITDNVSTGPGISFNAKGQNDKLKNSAIQNRGGKLVTVAPKGAANAKAEWPMTRLRQARLTLTALAAGRSSVPCRRHLSQRRVSGLLTGLVYGLMALGLSVIFGVVRVVNFAHGEMMTIAMYLAVVLFAALRPRSAGDDGADRRRCCSRSAM